jgi:hypothetical protein
MTRRLKLYGSLVRPWLDRLASVELTLTCVILAMGLVAAGTLAQVRLGTFAAQKEFFNSFWLYGELGGYRLPLYPGGLTVGALWMVTLVASFISRFRWSRKDMGIFISHAGLIFLLAGQFFTQTLARESQMPILVGESSNYSENPQSFELACIKTSDPAFDEVTVIPESHLQRQGNIHAAGLPVDLFIRRYFRNSQLRMAPSGAGSLATQGIGMRVEVQDIPPITTDDDFNTPSAYVDVREGTRSLGVWLVSAGLGAPQFFHAQGADYQLVLRPRRTYYPFTLTLKNFQHDIYPGTDIPKNFSSTVLLSDPRHKENRETLIYMNHPLRYDGKTFYQASFGEGDQLSVFQVVDNPASLAPYLSCALVVIGLLIQFLSHLIAFTRRRT